MLDLLCLQIPFFCSILTLLVNIILVVINACVPINAFIPGKNKANNVWQFCSLFTSFCV